MRSEKILWPALVLFFFLGLYLLSFIVLVSPAVTGVISRYTSRYYDFNKVGLVTNYVDGASKGGDISFLSEREQRHLEDVREIIYYLKVYATIFFAIAFVIFHFKFRTFNIKETIEVYKKYFRYVLVGLPVVILSLVLFFSWFFYLFHKLLFTNNLWLLPSDSMLIRLFSQRFFLVFFVLYNLLFLVVGWVLAKVAERIAS